MRRLYTVTALLLSIGFAPAYSTSKSQFKLGAGAVLETGDTWVLDRRRYRLFGVQSCLRGTRFTDKQGRRQDCGDASLAVLAAFIKDTHPTCVPIALAASVTYVVCLAGVRGRNLDLGTMLVSKGFAFAALDSKGLPINPAYSVAEQQAKSSKSGLWQFTDVQHPSLVLGRAVNRYPGGRQ